MRRAVVACGAFWLVSAMFLGIGAIAANPTDPGAAEDGFVERIADERVAAGQAGYVVADDLADVARRHAEEMRRQQRLHHNPRLGDDVQGWQAVGENVGVGPSVEAIHQKFMESPSHRDNILSGRFTEVGIGVAVDGADLWVVQVFRLPRSAEPTAAPASAQPTPPPSAEPSPPTTGPEPRPAPEPSGATGPSDGRVRAATSATTSAPPAAGGATPAAAVAAAPATSAPSTFSDAATAASIIATPPPEVPTSLVDAPASTAPSPAASVRPTLAVDAGRVDGFGSASERHVTWPVALAATMLLGVVAALLTQVGGARVRQLAGNRTSLLDVWELALAR